MRKDILERKQEILQWIEQNQSKAFMCKELNCKQETLNKYLVQMDIDYKGNQAGKGITKQRQDYMPLEQYLSKLGYSN